MDFSKLDQETQELIKEEHFKDMRHKEELKIMRGILSKDAKSRGKEDIQ